MSNFLPSSAPIKQMLLKIYTCKEPFELYVVDRKFKRRLGTYFVEKQKINIYAKGMDGHIIMEVAIHEYAHHIHHTEQYTWDVRRKDRSHGEKFWRIYSAPMAKAICKDIFKDDLICDIITQ